MQIQGADRQFTLFFDNVRVGADRLLGNEGQGLSQVFVGLNPERILGAALANGAALSAIAQASRYANEREVWGKPIGTHAAHRAGEPRDDPQLHRTAFARASEVVLSAWVNCVSGD